MEFICGMGKEEGVVRSCERFSGSDRSSEPPQSSLCLHTCLVHSGGTVPAHTCVKCTPIDAANTLLPQLTFDPTQTSTAIYPRPRTPSKHPQTC